jgi:histone deacetylase 1/2
MKPTRIRMCHSLVMNYGLYKKMEIFVSSSRSCVPPPKLIVVDRERNPLQSEKCPSSTRTNTSTSYIA